MPKLRGALEITQFNPLLLQTDTPQLSQGLFRLPWQEWRACLPEYHLLYFIEQQDRKWPQWRFLPTDLWKRVHAKNLSTRSTSTSLLVLFYLPYSVLKLDSLGQKRMPKVMKSHLHDYVTLSKTSFADTDARDSSGVWWSKQSCWERPHRKELQAVFGKRGQPLLISQQKVGVLNYIGFKEMNPTKNLKKLKCDRFFQSWASRESTIHVAKWL